LGLLILSPLILILAVAVKLSSPGSVFFRQLRVGRGRREFRLIKFRTMRLNAETSGPGVTARGDIRITPVGRFLRRTKLDELPELWNVLIGNLSLVGPRPEVPQYAATYLPEWERIFSIRPGITDPATLQFRDEEAVLEVAQDSEAAYVNVVIPMKVKLALDYVDNRTIWLDLKLLILTLWGITLGRVFAHPDSRMAAEAILAVQKFEETGKLKSPLTSPENQL
jgi:lipopolysaccharide/colanic/teichoic acid biosynthesis glycosyltransferase